MSGHAPSNLRNMARMATTEAVGATTSPTQFLGDEELAERLLAHIEHGTTDRAAESWREPAEHYRSPERFDREIDLLRRFPTPFCPSAALPEAGS